MNTIQFDSKDRLLPSEYMISLNSTQKDGVQTVNPKQGQGDGVNARSKTPIARKLQIIPEGAKQRKYSNR